jgi:hypothetical protein
LRVDYTGNFENSTFEIRYGASKIEAWVDGVKVDELVREVVYSVSGGGSISNNSVLPYGSSVDFTPTTSGDYVITAIINNVRRVEQQIHIAIDPDGVNSVGNATVVMAQEKLQRISIKKVMLLLAIELMVEVGVTQMYFPT